MEDIFNKYPTLGLGGFNSDKLDNFKNNVNIELINEIKNAIIELYKPIKSYSTAQSSYGMKHTIEHHINKYNSNGEFILAMLLLGYKPKILSNSKNCLFKVSLKNK
jgi:hypothetical protein